MALEVFDYRTDQRNVLITPAIRARFEYLAPGTVGVRHNHDVSTEIWLVLQGRIEFEVEDERAVLEPGYLRPARPEALGTRPGGQAGYPVPLRYPLTSGP